MFKKKDPKKLEHILSNAQDIYFCSRTQGALSVLLCFGTLSSSGMNTVSSVQFSSVTQSSPTLCDPVDCSMPGFPVHHQFPELTQTHVHWVDDAIQPSHPLSPSFPASGSFLMSRLFASGGQSIGASASASVLPMNFQGWFPLGLTGLIPLLS